MKMSALAHASINQLSLVSLQLQSCHVDARHQHIMQSEEIERFIYIKSGEVCFYLSGSELRATERDMVYLPSNTPYRSLWTKNAEFVVLDLLIRNESGQPISFNDSPCVLFNDSHHIYDGLLKELAQKAKADGPFDWLERMSLTFKLLCEMARDTNRGELDRKMQHIKAGIAYLEAHFTESFYIDHLAKVCSLSPSAFRRLFIACKGMTPIEYRNRLRINKATELLKSGQYTINEAAEAVGIDDIKYFGKLFKRYTGLTAGAVSSNCFAK